MFWRFHRIVLSALSVLPGLIGLIGFALAGTVVAGECEQIDDRPAWLFCDDFSAPPTSERYFSVDDADGVFVWQADRGVDNSGAMVASWEPGQVGAGNLQLLIGANPLAVPDIGSKLDRYQELYYRHYFWLAPGWDGDPYKLSRVTMLTDDQWSQAMIAHIWSGNDQGRLAIDPVSCTTAVGELACQGYNDFANMRWLGLHNGTTLVHRSENSGRWHCIEARVKLNDAGQSNGVQQFWLNGKLEASAEQLNFVGDFDEYGLNGLFIENWWNGGAPGVRTRIIDNLVVSTEPIGCLSLDDFISH